jgi:3-deoxy-manno-octulosonate cytidylyltransferase (CMP-KDO synthetase)
MRFIGIIPARYASTRFPGKPLADINGKSMIQRVVEQARKSSSLSEVVVATDDERIRQHVEGFGGKVIMTSTEHQSGTDRCYEALQKAGSNWDAVVNIQGDEPYIFPEQIDLVCSCFISSEVQIATLVKKLKDHEELVNVNSPKVILDKRKQAIYFSRTAIPFYRGKDQSEWLSLHTYYKHIGIYAYRTDVLKEITRIRPSSLEIAESLEQLRWIENGYRISVEVTDYESVAVDVPEDIHRLPRNSG